MNEEDKKDLYKLRYVYKESLSICNPIEFQLRQLNLLYKIADILLKPLDEDDRKKFDITHD